MLQCGELLLQEFLLVVVQWQYGGCVDNSLLACIPTVFSVVDSYPKVSIIGVDKLNRDMILFLGVNVVPSSVATTQLKTGPAS